VVAILIQGGKLVDPVRNRVEEQDLLIEQGRIARILPAGAFSASDPGLRIIDARNRLVVPGLVDMHVHLREPGYEHKETIATGSLSGVAGGFTALACMPNTKPVNDRGEITAFILDRAREANLCRIYPIAAISVGQRGESLADFGELRKAGAVGVSDDGQPVKRRELMRQAMELGRSFGLAVISHCEDLSLSAGGVMHEGSVSSRLGLKGIPAASEEVMVQREISLARETGVPVHIAHVSTAGSVERIRRAKEEGLPVTAETAPHYFSLDHRAVEEYNTCAKMNPPLREPEDVEAVKKGLAEGVIDAIATDHAPHSREEKNTAFDQAPFGIVGLETAVPLTLTLVREGILTWPEAVRKLSYAPATILGVEGGVLREGAAADLAVLDPEYSYVVRAEDMRSKSKNSPFIGWSMKGINLMTMVGGRIVWERSL
jgi:dihydroorotase